MHDVAIDIKHLSFAYRRGDDRVFSDLSLTIRNNEVTCILGHNGAGKTTLLHLIYGTLQRAEGSVTICSPNVRTYGDIFFYSGDSRQNRDLSTRQIIRFRELAFARKPDLTTVRGLVKRFNFGKHLDTPTKNLSSGNKVRSSFIAGLSFRPTLLLLDEPTNSIDPETRECLKGLVQTQKLLGSAIVLVTHDLDFAHAVANRALVIEHGEIVHEDGEIGLLGREEFTRQYLRYTAERSVDV